MQKKYTPPTKLNWQEFDNKYNYQPKLTPRLDKLQDAFTQQTINEIVLWKVNRYAEIGEEVCSAINALSTCPQYRPSETEVREVLDLLLNVHGIHLAMASTILRFKNPHAFQIIDQRVYRFLYGEEMSDKIGADEYIVYLRDLRLFCAQEDIAFSKADRILYEADKRLNKGKKLRW